MPNQKFGAFAALGSLALHGSGHRFKRKPGLVVFDTWLNTEGTIRYRTDCPKTQLGETKRCLNNNNKNLVNNLVKNPELICCVHLTFSVMSRLRLSANLRRLKNAIPALGELGTESAPKLRIQPTSPFQPEVAPVFCCSFWLFWGSLVFSTHQKQKRLSFFCRGPIFPG